MKINNNKLSGKSREAFFCLKQIHIKRTVFNRLAKNNSYTKHLLHLFIQFQSLETAEQQRFEEHVVILVISDVRAPALSLQQLVSSKKSEFVQLPCFVFRRVFEHLQK